MWEAILGGAAGLVALETVAAGIFGRLYRNERRPDATYFARTDDGWNLALHYHAPAPDAPRRRPVICCHGLSGNHHGFDLTARTSLARFLAAAGHPTYLLELRGAGASDHGGPLRDRPLEWRLSDHYKHDAPAAIDRVLELTGADRVHWIGHSMGGMIAYAFLQSPLAAKVSRCVILASPITFQHLRVLHTFRHVLHLIPGVPLRSITQSVAPLFESSRILQELSGNTNLLPGHAALSAANCQDQTPSRLLWDFTNFIGSGFYENDDGRSFLEGMKDITTPMLFMAGEADQTAASGSVQAAYQACGAEKKLVLLSRRQGHKTEYGHMTILLGANVYDEVFPHIAAWLAEA